jgi:hypothetical protein
VSDLSERSLWLLAEVLVDLGIRSARPVCPDVPDRGMIGYID